MRDIDENGYMYLGLAETDKIKEKLTKEKFIIEYLWWLWLMMLILITFKVNHLPFMNSLKLFGKNKEALDSLTKTLHIFNWHNGMYFEKKKCWVVILGKRKETWINGIKACVCHFIIFHYMIAFKNYEKSFLFHLKSSLYSQDIHIFVFPPYPLFLLVDHCFRGWFKINPKVYDVIHCQNKNLITHFIWYLENRKRYNIETLSIDKVLRNIFTEKSCRKCASKDSPTSLFNFGK